MSNLVVRMWMCAGVIVGSMATPAQAEPTGKLKVLGGVPGADVVVDDVKVGQLPMRHALSVDAGNRTLALVVNGQVTYEHEISIEPRKRTRHRIPAQATSAPPAESAPERPATATTPKVPATTPTLSPATQDDATADAPVLRLRRIVSIPTLPVADTGDELGLAVGAAIAAPQSTALDLSPSHVAKAASDEAADARPAEAKPEAPLLPGRAAPAAIAAMEDGEQSDDEILDMFIFESFAGPSFMAMALGRDNDVIAELAALPVDGSGDVDLSQIEASDVLRTVSGAGSTVGGAASIRLAFISLGGRLSYSSYDELDVMTLTGELAFRAYAQPVEFYLGFGLGGGFLYDQQVQVNQTDGLALRVGLGLNFRIAKHMSLGVGADAVGWFLAGKGISPAQLGDIDQDTDHPMGGQIPIQANFSVLL